MNLPNHAVWWAQRTESARPRPSPEGQRRPPPAPRRDEADRPLRFTEIRKVQRSTAKVLEARAAGRLMHPNIVVVYEAGELQGLDLRPARRQFLGMAELAADEAAARALMEGDPLVKSGAVKAELRPFRIAFLRGRD